MAKIGTKLNLLNQLLVLGTECNTVAEWMSHDQESEGLNPVWSWAFLTSLSLPLPLSCVPLIRSLMEEQHYCFSIKRMFGWAAKLKFLSKQKDLTYADSWPWAQGIRRLCLSLHSRSIDSRSIYIRRNDAAPLQHQQKMFFSRKRRFFATFLKESLFFENVCCPSNFFFFCEKVCFGLEAGYWCCNWDLVELFDKGYSTALFYVCYNKLNDTEALLLE